ncbi:MAG: hypothetical protein ONB48_08220 [candidate division KSB1 bacterium]|nr:hypothetical protein [candidate division KSB1 bacterium]MDZ7274806.1 hypothetical protein [candidate division KSB1 bacterium]MDZ7285631.1 hypothetical protein [candidate division KSB1 bacterium]MDZ7298663.1 hypothetical protein [candidate division KSB1 bacterium]MDZ7308798.1 hypothetical protein [candidate division KSB1 bacterium]
MSCAKLLFALLFVGVLLLPQASLACPGCAQAASGALGRGFNTSILFLMAMPFAIVGGVALCLFLLQRRHRFPARPRPVPLSQSET